MLPYGGLPIKRFARGGLAPWQLRCAYEFIDGNLGADPSIPTSRISADYRAAISAALLNARLVSRRINGS